MSALITLSQVSLNRDAKPLFADLSLVVNRGDRIGLVGHNGSGKSSLLALMAGDIELDAGRRQVRRDLVIGRVEQFVPEELQAQTLLQAAIAALPATRRLEDGHRAEAELFKLGFNAEQLAQSVASLSGGQQNLLLLARAILIEPDVLLLDEPGNHLDILSLTLLRQWLQSQSVPWVMVSHDRHLLNALCTQTWFLRDQRLYHFNLPFDAARQALAEADEQARARRAEEEKEVARLQASAKRLAHWGHTYDNEDLSRKAKTMEKRVERLKADLTFVSQGSGLALALPEEGLTARQVLVLENARIDLPGDQNRSVTCEFLNVRPGDRIALLGVNGVGKSTSLKRMMAAVGDEEGDIRWNPRVQLGYYDQLLSSLETNVSRFDWLRERLDGPDDAIRQTLLNAGVPYERFDQPVHSLSGGEKARLMFALFRLQRPNVLILDEPTNHLDLEGRQELIESLTGSDMTVLMTSHDRTFLDDVATRWWWIEAGVLREIDDPAAFYRQLEAGGDASPSSSSTAQNTSVLPDSEDAMLARLDWLEQQLSDDQARKPKHQKPERQAQWKAEIAELWQRLER
ncbi:ABC-F family ATP-binding cassette domain-containing protein [Saccharospirillum mangrovi]|uniref:ABC-F family ATP-binding cassette domain-containing protein n=1 Tax=Saccharospirillum mangrovi TaxID=2161747 RepID=UPI000D348CF2|nr:ABC-F family ATP-binding cassette domain-containing protein [Saccharospirillum mangrovi]